MRSSGRYTVALSALLLLFSFAAVTMTAEGQELAFNYDVTPHTFRVCVLLVPPAFDNPNAYIFVGLQQSPWWPNGWELENPLAPACVNDYVAALWTDSLYPATHFDTGKLTSPGSIRNSFPSLT